MTSDTAQKVYTELFRIHDVIEIDSFEYRIDPVLAEVDEEILEKLKELLSILSESYDVKL